MGAATARGGRRRTRTRTFRRSAVMPWEWISLPPPVEPPSLAQVARARAVASGRAQHEGQLLVGAAAVLAIVFVIVV